jgi:hypothetical protein
MKNSVSARFTWAICCMFLMLSSTLTMSSITGFFFPNSIWTPVFSLLICAFYSIECTRQTHVKLKKWPTQSIFILAPLSLFSLLLPSTFIIKIAIAGTSFLFWILAYICIRQLLKISDKNRAESVSTLGNCH